ncbi:hypothetical protein FC62_GL001384 [Amylolactobacillus amylotrophicus DSM 20534]|uniref:Uncharacterized protein n=3 Tax=Amylolactobacillus TaxID=2767876 RepID=A0A0R1YLB7_9LACO|nr:MULTISPECIES: class A sortase [Amylolactobacillus]APT17986.1 hypothetical protein LA20533_01010 [Amylolactobacillus amylophilus DSM 20533 = JCM 1125]KRK37269.1 hypothetical protein FC62_GL001384 [Amylolactobacillus amylotrophicus DSM 20534]KRM41668.1 hypothetical protein FD40_GL001230 [Amylolactobacillus amylophilus DSM 20533 = JCM 1125]GED80734.1 hypothetical protein LAM01_12070 [Amylolactobacillus amylophilus]
MAIPCQKVSLPILAERTDANLSVGAAEYTPHQKMGHGNYVLASHNYAGADVLLNRIKNLAAGQKIYLTDFSQIFMYQVTLLRVINEREIHYLAQTENPTLTLIRCEEPVGTDQRLIVQAKLVSLCRGIQKSPTSCGTAIGDS